MRILSIDFDYFQEVDVTTAKTCYPDGVDLPPEITEYTWSDYYVSEYSKDKISNVSIREDELNKLYSLLDSQEVNIPIMVSYSHKYIFDFVNELTDNDYTTRLSVTNLDMHHDMFNDNPELDCGNWATHFMNTYPEYNHIWIANPISKEVYGFSEKQESIEYDNAVFTSIDDIKKKNFDAVFLCRSDNWLPPHLDKYFDELLNQIKLNFNDIRVQECILKPRTKYIEYGKQINEFYKKHFNIER